MLAHRRRRAPILCGEVLLDSGAFNELRLHGHYRNSPEDHAALIRSLVAGGVLRGITAAVAQDYTSSNAPG